MTRAETHGKHAEPRRERKRRWKLAVLGALIIIAALVLRCGGGWGLGGFGLGTGSRQHETSPAKRCVVRVTAGGIFVDGAKHTRDEAVAACKANGAEVVITGDAREGDWQDLEAALRAGGVDMVVRPR